MKIGFTGTHSTGKTEKTCWLSRNLQLPICTEVARHCPFPINKVAGREAQLWIFCSMVRKELNLQKEFPSGMICDRTLADTLAYSKAVGLDCLVRQLWSFSQDYMKTYDKIYFCRPLRGSLPENDRVRDQDPLWRLKVDRIVESILKDMGVKVIQIKTLDDLKGIWREEYAR